MTTGPKSQCGYCTRLQSPWNEATAAGVTGPWCAAFPGGVPEVIWTNQFDHRQPFDGDHGLQWEALPGATYPKPDFPKEAIMTAAADPATQAARTGCMIALIPTADWVDKLRLDEVDGALPADQIHLTVADLGEVDMLADTTREAATAAAQAVAGQTRPVQAEAFGVGLLNPLGDQPCVVLLCSGDDLDSAYSAMCGMLHMDGVDLSDMKRPWLAHITLAYTDDTYAAADVTDRCGPVNFDRLRVAFGPDVTDLPLAGDTGIHDQPSPATG